MSSADPSTEDTVSIISFDDELYLEDDYPLPGADTRIQHWLSQQCRFALEVNNTTSLFDVQKEEKDLPEPELLSVSASEERADSPLLGFKVGEDDERTLMDPLRFPSATYIRNLPGDTTHVRSSPSSATSSDSFSSANIPRSLHIPQTPLHLVIQVTSMHVLNQRLQRFQDCLDVLLY